MPQVSIPRGGCMVLDAASCRNPAMREEGMVIRCKAAAATAAAEDDEADEEYDDDQAEDAGDAE